jgi:hypothetical protein
MTYKGKFTTLVVSLVAVIATVLLPAQAHGQTCNAATIQGSYAFRFSGFFGPGPAPSATQLNIGSFSPGAQAGRIVFTPNSPTSSDGTLTGSQAGNIGGVPTENTFTGIYSVNSDCTGTFTRNVTTFAIAIAQSGAEIEFAFFTSATPRVGEGLMKKQ